jgi:hypothetical protein
MELFFHDRLHAIYPIIEVFNIIIWWPPERHGVFMPKKLFL